MALKGALAGVPDDGPEATQSLRIALQRMPQGTNNGGGKYLSHTFGLTRASWDAVCPTLVKEPKRMGHPSGSRFLSIAAAKRVGSFPDAFRMLGKYELQWNRIGNSVPPLLMRSIAAHVRSLVS